MRLAAGLVMVLALAGSTAIAQTAVPPVDVAGTQARAATGDVDAEHNLAVLYYNGTGVKQDYVAALMWFEKAASQDSTQDQALAGAMRAEGLGAPYDPVKAYVWLKLAANKGDALAINGVTAFEPELTPQEFDLANHLVKTWKPGG